MATLTRVNVKAVLDYLLARVINADQADARLTALGAPQKHLAQRFLSAELSISDIYSLLEV